MQWDETAVRKLKSNEEKAREEFREANKSSRKQTELKDLKDRISGITNFFAINLKKLLLIL